MSPTNHPRCRTGAAIAGLAAIPFVSVTVAAAMADLSSSPEPSAGAAGVVALIAGVAMGVLVRRVLGAVRSGLGVARIMVERMADRVIGVFGAIAFSLAVDPTDPQQAPPAFVPAAVGRRGPPLGSN